MKHDFDEDYCKQRLSRTEKILNLAKHLYENNWYAEDASDDEQYNEALAKMSIDSAYAFYKVAWGDYFYKDHTEQTY